MPPQGVYAAVLVPRSAAGELDEPGFRGILEFLAAGSVPRVVINGATGEYPCSTPRELARLLSIARQSTAGAEMFCGIGAPSLAGCLELGRAALDGGASTLLLPMPYFFPYAQDDLEAFCTAVACSLNAPMLLYNLPRFTTPIEGETVGRLIAAVPNIIGIKDSSGSLTILRSLPSSDVTRLVGDDSALVQALNENVCDGVVSGVAGVLPELISFLYHQRESADYARADALLREFIAHLSVFPVPWGLKLAAECRGLACAAFQQPLSSTRQRQAAEFRAWFSPWLSQVQSL
jgi:4-hydroxy-tetrahydrodipicolinate synthase